MLLVMINKIKKTIKNKKEVKIGKNTRVLTSWLNFGSEPYLIEIGNNCTITSGVKFITHDASIGVILNYRNKKRVMENNVIGKFGKIKIGNNVMIGVNTILLPGVEIGSNTIIGAGSIVTKSFGDNLVLGGNPAKIICTLDEYEKRIKKSLQIVPLDLKQRRENLIKNLMRREEV